MSVSIKRNQMPIDNDDLAVPILPVFVPFTFESKGDLESLRTGGSMVVTTDLGMQLFREIVEWKKLPVTPLPIQVSEVQDWERIIEKLDALEAVSGMLDELSTEQMEIFETSVKRRALFR